jgi:hypothetical protein
MINEGWFQVSQTSFSEILSAPTHSQNFWKFVFSASVNFKAILIKISWSNLIHIFQSS